jgi:hypothetical protein
MAPPKPSPPISPEELEAIMDSAALGEGEALPERSRTRSRQRKSRFIWTLPLDPYALAARLSSAAALVWTLIWYRARLTASPRITVPTKLLTEFGISRWTFLRALQRLEVAGLILTYPRGIGRPTEVELIELPESGAREGEDE